MAGINRYFSLKDYRNSIVLETYYLSVFSYTTLGTVITAITAGLVHDSQRWKFGGEFVLPLHFFPVKFHHHYGLVLIFIATFHSEGDFMPCPPIG